MVVIRLSRGGSKGRPFYDVVVIDSREARDSQPIERIGHYNPIATPAQVSIHFNLERFNYWKSQGAQPSVTVKNLIKKFLKAAPQATVAA